MVVLVVLGAKKRWRPHACRQDVEARLKQPVQAVNPDVRRPPEMARRGRPAPGSQAATYGQHREGGASQVLPVSRPLYCSAPHLFRGWGAKMLACRQV